MAAAPRARHLNGSWESLWIQVRRVPLKKFPTSSFPKSLRLIRKAWMMLAELFLPIRLFDRIVAS